MNEKPSLAALALTFNHIALASFGGGLSAWSREVIVAEKRWMDDEEFLSAVTMCRILPGANQVNLAVFVGVKFRGIPGAIAAVFGLTFLPALIALALAYFYFSYHHVPAVQGVLKGAAAAAVAMTISMAFKTGEKCLRGAMPAALFAAIFVANGLFRWPLLACLSLLAPLAVAWAWPKGKKS